MTEMTEKNRFRQGASLKIIQELRSSLLFHRWCALHVAILWIVA